LARADLNFVIGIAHVGGKVMFKPAPDFEQISTFMESMQVAEGWLQHAQAAMILSTSAAMGVQVPENLFDAGASAFWNVDKDEPMLVGNHGMSFLKGEFLNGRW